MPLYNIFKKCDELALSAIAMLYDILYYVLVVSHGINLNLNKLEAR